jgi:hypothetical protein
MRLFRGVACVLFVMFAVAHTVHAQQIGLGAGLVPIAGVDVGGSRLNVEEQGTLLQPGVYSVLNFQYNLGITGGTV